MRDNQPVTQSEYKFPSEERLISATDKCGCIQYVNDAFVKVSGFERSELIGQPHNIVRHPDMPEVVYKIMWKTISSGKPWMGLVKNRRKNGDHYWVSAYVTPIFENNAIIGYESVRVGIDSAQKARATHVYKRLKAGKSPFPISAFLSYYAKQNASGLLVSVVAAVTAYSVVNLTAGLIAFLAALLATLFSISSSERSLKQLIHLRPDAFCDSTTAYTYSKDGGAKARLEMMIRSEAARARTAITRVEDSVSTLWDIVRATREQADASERLIEEQNDKTQDVASAINQMSTSIQEVALSVENNSEKSEIATHNLDTGVTVAADALQAIKRLNEAVGSIADTVDELSGSTGEIGKAADLITAIAEQTNLLALNAAIEAARAGDHGRGFSVVADEVRSLATKTRASTESIHKIVDNLMVKAEDAVAVSQQGEKAATEGVEMVGKTDAALQKIRDAVQSITEMTIQMSSAVEQQSNVAEHINQQVNAIANSARTANDNAIETSRSSKELENTADQLYKLIQRFNSKN